MASILHSRKRGTRLGEHTTSPTHSQRDEGSKGLKWRGIFYKTIRWPLIALLFVILCSALARNRKLILNVLSSPWHHGGPIIRGDLKKNGFQHHFDGTSPRFVVVVDSGSEVNPANRHNRLASIHATWGPSARAIFVVNNVTEYPEASHAIISQDAQLEDPFSYPQLLLLPQDAMPDRSVAALKYTIRTVLKRVNPDFALFTNCHTYVIPDHVCHFLNKKSPSDNMYAGHALKVNNESFHPESAGYILSRRSMQNLVDKWNEDDPFCNDPKEGHPGFLIAKCLLKVFGVSAEDTRDDGKYNVFHSFPLMRLVTGKVDQWYLDLSEHENLFGDDCCSDNTVSFHYVEHLETRALYETRKALLANPKMSDEELKMFMIQVWPSNPSDMGGYSRALPKADEVVLWATVLRVMRRVSTLHSESSISCL